MDVFHNVLLGVLFDYFLAKITEKFEKIDYIESFIELFKGLFDRLPFGLYQLFVYDNKKTAVKMWQRFGVMEKIKFIWHSLLPLFRE